MSAPKKSGRPRRQRTDKPSTPKSAAKSVSKVTPQRRKAGDSLPDLTAVYYAFCDAKALVTVACEVLAHSRHAGAEATVLRLGVQALDRVSDQLEEAKSQLGRFRTQKAGEQRGAS